MVMDTAQKSVGSSDFRLPTDQIGALLHAALQSAEEGRACGEAQLRVTSLVREAGIYWELGNYAEAARCADEACDCAASDALRAAALCIRAQCVAGVGDLAQAHSLFQQAIDLARLSGAIHQQAQALRWQARLVYIPRGHYDLALAAVETADSLDRPDGTPSPGTLMGRILIGLHRGDVALARQALDAFAPYVAGNRPMAGAHAYLAACLALDEGDYNTARSYLQYAQTMAEISGHLELMVAVRIASSRWHRVAGSTASALAWADEAIGFAERAGNPDLIGQALAERGRVYWKMGDETAAERDLRAAGERFASLNAGYEQAHVELQLSALQQWEHQAPADWLDAAKQIEHGQYHFLLQRERSLIMPLLAASLHSTTSPLHGAAQSLLHHLQQVTPPPLMIAGLGRFEVWQGHRRIAESEWQQRQAGELFRFLLLQPQHSALHDQIVEALWPGHKAQATIPQLHKATSALRRLLEPDLPDKVRSRYLLVDDRSVTLLLPAGSSIDFEHYEQQLTAGLQKGDCGALTRILDQYPAILFPHDRYASWTAVERDRLLLLRQSALAAVGGWFLATGRAAAARQCADDILQNDPWNEDAVLLAMHACLALQDRPGALRRYAVYKRRLYRDLHLPPRGDIFELAASLTNS